MKSGGAPVEKVSKAETINQELKKGKQDNEKINS